MILKLSKVDFIYCPTFENNDQYIGLKSNCVIKAGKLEGQMKFNCKLMLPKDFSCKLDVSDKNFNDILEDLEFIKTVRELNFDERSIL